MQIYNYKWPEKKDMHEKGELLFCCLAYKWYGHGNITLYQLRILIIYSPEPGKPRKHSEEAFIALINQDTQKLFLFSYQLMPQRVGFHFPCRCFERDKISPPFARRIKHCVIWHESQMHTGASSALFGAPLQCRCNNCHPRLFWASFAPCFLACSSDRKRERERDLSLKILSVPKGD